MKGTLLQKLPGTLENHGALRDAIPWRFSPSESSNHSGVILQQGELTAISW
jgi:hypothetical protein